MPHRQFETHRPRLFALAYRMLGTRAEAEDVVQDVYLRWHDAAPAALDSAEAWLVTVTTRAAIDRLRAAQRERAHYVGPWLAEPIALDALPGSQPGPDQQYEFAQDVSVAFLAVLERLGVEERAAFLLHEVFDNDYREIAAMLGKSEAACRQMVHRARERVRAGRPRFAITPEHHRALLARFAEAARGGGLDTLRALFADDAVLVSDGGGKAVAALRPLQGAARIARLYHVLARQRSQMREAFRIVEFNGEPGLLHWLNGQLVTAYSVVGDGERIHALYAIRNPEKLAGLIGIDGALSQAV
ncbi:RNA polymerase subunit sigma-24 [Chitiniphilus shinanonensis]|uniref:RNA polymerase subunit sigma-24 n=1 Tax=Chitiniphilus shinanonensis TaxID=553088 RepID=A0ABQ6BXB7_9NEIS|nr:RNA polymerase sigma-70 factor [Chitiniphilus shinanonensis]GLS05141.1 RNA polymerase subunit sigma-24 [Chitiniphilus shinanonensis]